MLKRRLLALLLLTVLALAAPLAAGASAYTTGIGDQQTEMFTDAHWKQLHARVTRYITPYDTVARRVDLVRARAFITAATKAHQRVLVAFYHSSRTARRNPTGKVYKTDVQRFMRLFPQVREYQAWNEVNRGNTRAFASPSPSLAAGYYRIVRSLCPHCAITGLDILDQAKVGPSLRYISQFRSALRRLHVPTPHLWGLHNYSDTNRFGSSRTRAVLRAVPGQVWLTETGGIVKFGGAFPNRKGSGDRRAAKALSFMFRLAASNRRISRLYIYQWTGSGPRARFDAGLTDRRYVPRPGYVVVCKKLHGKRCRGFRIDKRN